jgi:hypothetical protein
MGMNQIGAGEVCVGSSFPAFSHTLDPLLTDANGRSMDGPATDPEWRRPHPSLGGSVRPSLGQLLCHGFGVYWNQHFQRPAGILRADALDNSFG